MEEAEIAEKSPSALQICAASLIGGLSLLKNNALDFLYVTQIIE
jgi:hypothetical protein